MVEDGRRLASMDFYDIITSFCKTKMLVVESLSSRDDSTIVNLFFSVGIQLGAGVELEEFVWGSTTSPGGACPRGAPS